MPNHLTDKQNSRGGRPRKDVIAITIKGRRCRKCGRFVSFEGNHPCGLKNTPALKQANNQHDYGDNQEKMNKASPNAESDPKEPA